MAILRRFQHFFWDLNVDLNVEIPASSEFPSTRKTFVVLSFFAITSMLIIILPWAKKKNENIKLYYNHSRNSTSSNPISGYVTVKDFWGRLGNQMFEFATLFYVALRTNREVVLFSGHNGHELEEYFTLRVRKINRSCPCFLFHENILSYDSHMDKIIISETATNCRTILLQGYFQSWKYLEPVQNSVLTHIKFVKTIEVFARDILRENSPKGWTEGQFTRVGIHNRRGDYLKSMWSSVGITTAPESYFKKAMKYFVDRYELIQFIVASDDIEWSRQHITYDSQSSFVNVTYSEKHSPGQDMAILSLCDHVIISSGTFGYMSAWLANGTTVYYSNYPRNGSPFSKRLNRLDYYPPHWIPME